MNEAARRPDDLHRERQALPRRSAVLAGAGHRLRRQRARLVRHPAVHQGEPAGQPAVAGRQRDGRRDHRVPLGPAGVPSSYDLEVFKNDDATYSTANRVVNKAALKTAAYAHTDPLSRLHDPLPLAGASHRRQGQQGPVVRGRTLHRGQPGAAAAGPGCQRQPGPQRAGPAVVAPRRCAQLQRDGHAADDRWDVHRLAEHGCLDVRRPGRLRDRRLPVDGDGARRRRQHHRDRVLDLHGRQRDPARAGAADRGDRRHCRRQGRDQRPARVERARRRQQLPVAAQRRADHRRHLDELHLDRRRREHVDLAPGHRRQAGLRQRRGAQQRARRHPRWRPAAHRVPDHHGHALPWAEPLTGNPGTWPTSFGRLTFAYAWLRDGAPITGATTTSYTPTSADLGAELVFRVTASASGYNDGVASSSALTVASLAPRSLPQISAPSGTGVERPWSPSRRRGTSPTSRPATSGSATGGHRRRHGRRRTP